MTRYQLMINVVNLPKSFLRGCPSPYASVMVIAGPKEGTDVGKTETVPRTQNPDFTTVLFVETDPSEIMEIAVRVYDDRGGGPADDVLLGEARFEVISILESKGQIMYREVPSNRARISVSVEESIRGDTQGYLTLHLRGLDIKNVEPGCLGLGRSDPFYELSRKYFDGKGMSRWNVIYRSEHIDNHLNPYWDEISNISLETVCCCDLNTALKITVLDHNTKGNTTEIGEVETTLETLMDHVAFKGNADRDKALELRLPEKPNKVRGYIVVLKADIERIVD